MRWALMSLNIYGCHAGLEMAISELKTASLRIHLQYSVHTRDALGKQKLGRTLISKSKTFFILQNFQIGPCAGPQNPEYVTLPKIKYEKFRPKMKMLH